VYGCDGALDNGFPLWILSSRHAIAEVQQKKMSAQMKLLTAEKFHE
jgi:hypothetical protein